MDILLAVNIRTAGWPARVRCEGQVIRLQASKSDEEQPSIASTLPAFSPDTVADVCVIGCGPAGLALSSELAKQGLSVCLIGKMFSEPTPNLSFENAAVSVQVS